MSDTEQPAEAQVQQKEEEEAKEAAEPAPEQAEGAGAGGGEEEKEPQAASEEVEAAKEDGGEPEKAEEKREESGGGGGDAGEVEAAAKEGAEEEGGEGGEKQTEEETAVKHKPAKKIVISYEDNPNWLSVEECQAKGVPAEEVSSFQNLYFQHAYSLKTWHQTLSAHAIRTEFVDLSNEEVDILLAASHAGQSELPELTDEQKESLGRLEMRLTEVVERFVYGGAFIGVNDRSPIDSILDRNDAEFVAKVRDAVVNEIEVENQSRNAYLIWRDQKHEGPMRRGITRIRKSFRRERSQTSLPAKKEEEPTKPEETTDAKEEGTEDQNEEAPKTGGEGEGEGGEKKGEGGEQTVTVEVTVDEDQSKSTSDSQQDTPAADAELEAGAGEQQKETEQKEEEEGKGGEEGKEGEREEEEGEGQKEGEADLQKAPEDDESPKTKPTASKEMKEEHHFRIHKSKNENIENEVLRAFGRALINMLKVCSGKDALDLILRSGRIKQYLQQVKACGGHEALPVFISVTTFHPDIPCYPGMVLRAFVYEGELTALSQKHDNVTFFPSVVQYRDIIVHKVKQLFTEHLKEQLADRGNYLVDVFVSTEKVFVLRMSPFYTGVGACLYNWSEDVQLLTKGACRLKIIEAPGRAPDLYSSFQSQWSSMLDSVLQQIRSERGTQSQPRGPCTIL